MGSSPSDLPDNMDFTQDGFPPAPRRFEFPEPAGHPYVAVRVRREPVWRYVILFLLTVLSTTYFGQLHYASFVVGFTDRALGVGGFDLFVRGFWYSASILGILGAHEMGHY